MDLYKVNTLCYLHLNQEGEYGQDSRPAEHDYNLPMISADTSFCLSLSEYKLNCKHILLFLVALVQHDVAELLHDVILILY